MGAKRPRLSSSQDQRIQERLNEMEYERIQDFLREGGIPNRYLDTSLDAYGDEGISIRDMISQEDDPMLHLVDTLFHGSLKGEGLGYALIRALRLVKGDSGAMVLSVMGIAAMREYLRGTFPVLPAGLHETYLDEIVMNCTTLFIPDFVSNLGTEQALNIVDKVYVEDFIRNRFNDGKLTFFYSPHPIERMENVWTDRFLLDLKYNALQIAV